MRFSKRECVLLTALAVLLIWSGWPDPDSGTGYGAPYVRP